MTTAIENPNVQTAARRDETRGGAAMFSPRCDIFETDAEVVLAADMPGASPDGVDVKYENGELTLYARCAPRPREDARALLGEYAVGDWYRQFRINELIDADKIDAGYRNGVLTVRLPKAEAAKPRKIPVRG